MKCTKKWEERKSKVNGNGKSPTDKKPSAGHVLLLLFHGRTKLDTAGFICAEEDDKQTNTKKFVENFTFFVKIRHIKYTNMLAVTLNQLLIKKEGAGGIQNRAFLPT